MATVLQKIIFLLLGCFFVVEAKDIQKPTVIKKQKVGQEGELGDTGAEGKLPIPSSSAAVHEGIHATNSDASVKEGWFRKSQKAIGNFFQATGRFIRAPFSGMYNMFFTSKKAPEDAVAIENKDEQEAPLPLEEDAKKKEEERVEAIEKKANAEMPWYKENEEARRTLDPSLVNILNPNISLRGIVELKIDIAKQAAIANILPKLLEKSIDGAQDSAQYNLIEELKDLDVAKYGELEILWPYVEKAFGRPYVLVWESVVDALKGTTDVGKIKRSFELFPKLMKGLNIFEGSPIENEKDSQRAKTTFLSYVLKVEDLKNYEIIAEQFPGIIEFGVKLGAYSAREVKQHYPDGYHMTPVLDYITLLEEIVAKDPKYYPEVNRVFKKLEEWGIFKSYRPDGGAEVYLDIGSSLDSVFEEEKPELEEESF